MTDVVESTADEIGTEVVCRYCGEDFAPHDPRQQYCGPPCRAAQATRVRAARRESYVCAGCGGVFERAISSLEKGATGMCNRCARPRGPANPQWNGGQNFNRSLGRWYVARDGKRILRARAVMEDHLGRQLDSREHVHHINGDKTDDRIENLTVLDIAEHARLHARMRKAAS